MFHWKHKISRAALQCAFVLIGLIFLAVQLSGKFYAWSSQVVFAKSAKTVKPGIHSTHPHVLSLDKRYKAQKIFGLLIRPAQHDFTIAPVNAPNSPAKPAPLTSRQKALTALRGPPITA